MTFNQKKTKEFDKCWYKIRTDYEQKNNTKRTVTGRQKKGRHIDWLVLFAMWPQINKMPLVDSRLNILDIYIQSYRLRLIFSLSIHIDDLSLGLCFFLFDYSISVVYEMVSYVRLQSPSVDYVFYINMGCTSNVSSHVLL